MPQRPIFQILQICLKSIAKVFFDYRSTSITTHLRQTGKTRFDSMAVPVALIDFPKKLIGGT